MLWTVGLLQERGLLLTVVKIWEPSTARRMVEQFEAMIQLKSASKHEQHDSHLGGRERGICGKLFESHLLLFVERET